jgi:hypothetical protein
MNQHRRIFLSLLLTLAMSARGQTPPIGIYYWEDSVDGVKLVGEYIFDRDEKVYLTIRGIEPLFKYSGRWELREQNVVIHAADGGEQTYMWVDGDLVLIANTTGMPKEKVVLKPRTRGQP